MSTRSRQFQVRRDDLTSTRWQSVDLPELAAGEVLLQVDQVGFTANNVTYATRGEGLFWKFFPAPDDWFRVPVWGFAQVVSSRKAGVVEGDRVYGYLPISSHLVVAVDQADDSGFTVADPHRAPLPAIYNRYHRTASDPTYRREREAQQVLLRPVFRTSFMLDNYLADNAAFGASRVILGSASSKTALGLAFLLQRKRRRRLEIVGLSARRNDAFLRRVGYFDRIVTYDDLGELTARTPSAYVDMSGDAAVRAGVHERLGESLAFDLRVGSTHWANMDDRPVRGVQPVLFSMADQMKKRLAEWGPAEVQRRLAADWGAFLDSTDGWLKPAESRGEADVETVYCDMLAGRTSPEQGHVLRLGGLPPDRGGLRPAAVRSAVSSALTLRRRVAGRELLHVMAAHSPLSARLAQEAGFDAIWASGFELSALYGLADVSLLSMTQHLEMVRAMAGACVLPIVADLDTGYGNAVNVDHVVREYERAGVQAVVIEDKTFPKVTSLLEGGRQELLRIEEFEGKIAAACAARHSRDLLVIARTEALIAGLGEAEALRRCQAYAQAGADMVLVHSKSDTSEEIERVVEAWRGEVPIVLVPTSYPDLTVKRMAELGKIRMVIYGNHAIRASIAAMQSVFAQIIRDRGHRGVEAEIAPVTEVFRLQQMDRVKALEDRFLR